MYATHTNLVCPAVFFKLLSTLMLSMRGPAMSCHAMPCVADQDAC